MFNVLIMVYLMLVLDGYRPTKFLIAQVHRGRYCSFWAFSQDS